MHHYKAPHDYFENAELRILLANMDVPEPETLWKRYPNSDPCNPWKQDELIPTSAHQSETVTPAVHTSRLPGRFQMNFPKL